MQTCIQNKKSFCEVLIYAMPTVAGSLRFELKNYENLWPERQRILLLHGRSVLQSMTQP